MVTTNALTTLILNRLSKYLAYSLDVLFSPHTCCAKYYYPLYYGSVWPLQNLNQRMKYTGISMMNFIHQCNSYNKYNIPYNITIFSFQLQHSLTLYNNSTDNASNDSIPHLIHKLYMLHIINSRSLKNICLCVCLAWNIGNTYVLWIQSTSNLYWVIGVLEHSGIIIVHTQQLSF